LQFGALLGITTYAGISRKSAAKANAAAWLPLFLEDTISKFQTNKKRGRTVKHREHGANLL